MRRNAIFRTPMLRRSAVERVHRMPGSGRRRLNVRSSVRRSGVLMLGLMMWFLPHGPASGAVKYSTNGAVVHVECDDGSQFLDVIGPEAPSLIDWEAIDPDRRTELSLRVVPDAATVIRHAIDRLNVTALQLTGTATSDDDIAFIVRRCPDLRFLRVRNARTLDPRELEDLTKDDAERLTTSSLSAGGIRRLGELKNLRSLGIQGYSLSDDAFDFIADESKLDNIALMDVDVTDAVFGRLSRARHLDFLALCGTKVTGSELHRLEPCDSLRFLDLSRSPVDSSIIDCFRDSNALRLRGLHLTGCALNKEQLEQVRQVLPFTEVVDRTPDRPDCPGTMRRAQNVRQYGCGAERLRLEYRGNIEIHFDPTGAQKCVDGVTFSDTRNVGDWALIYTGWMGGVRYLDFSGSQVTDRGVTCLASLKSLESLDLSATRVDDSCLDDVRQLGGLVRLGLDRVNVTDDGVEKLQSLHHLRDLYLGGTRITDASLGCLSELPIELLRLATCDITDAAVGPLQKLSQLRHLDVRGTRMTPEGVRTLRMAMPETEILYETESALRTSDSDE